MTPSSISSDSAAGRPPARQLLTPALAIVAAVAVIVLACLARGFSGSVTVGPVRVAIHDYVNPLTWGVCASVFLLILERDRAFWRWTAGTSLAALGALAVVLFAIRAAPIITDSDFAVSELYVELATRGRLLLGAYSRFGWHHPGPLFFYLAAPFYLLSGHQAAALFSVALAINLGAFLIMVWVMARETNGTTTVMVAGACLLFAWRLPWFLASPWNAHVGVVPSLAFLVTAAAVACGRARLLPLMVILGTFAAQTHVGFAPMVLVITVAAAATRVFDRSGGPPWQVFNVSLWVAAVLWLLPISEALSRGGGNALALWRFFADDAANGHSMRDAITNGSYGLMGLFRPDFDLPWGGHFDLQYLWGAIPCALAEVVLLAVIARRDLAAGRRFDGCLALVALAASVIGLWGLTHLRGDILNHDVFRLAATGAINVGIIGAAAVRRWPTAAGRWLARPAATLAGSVLVLALAVTMGLRDLTSMTTFEQTRRQRASIVDAYRAVRDYMAVEGVEKPLVRIGVDRWADAAGVVLRLLQDGRPTAVMETNVSMFSDAFAATGDEDALITFADLDLHRELRERPDTVILLQAFPLFVDAVRITPARKRP